MRVSLHGAALTWALQVARRVGVADRPGGDEGGGGAGRREVVRAALVDGGEEMRLNGLEIVCLCSRNSEMPSPDDLHMVFPRPPPSPAHPPAPPGRGSVASACPSHGRPNGTTAAYVGRAVSVVYHG